MTGRNTGDTSAPLQHAHLPYIGAVVKAMEAAGLHVAGWDDSTDEYREALVTIVTRPGIDPEEEDGWRFTRFAVWDERHGWACGRDSLHGEIRHIEYFAYQYVPGPPVIAEAVKGLLDGDRTGLAAFWAHGPQGQLDARDADGEDPEFEAELAEYAKEEA